MRIGCISDTHLIGRELPTGVLDAFEGVDLILHAGDILEMAVVEQLSRIAETLAVKGNMDHGDVARKLPERRVVEAGDFKIGLTHGSGPPSGITWKVARLFENDGCDCIVFGHTHNSLIKERNGVLFFNPGSPTDKMFARRNTVGLLEVTDKIEPRIIEVSRDPKGQ
ncbi:MAG: metallophosphoesterase family protein [Candidatus Geothermincolia bacterium]